MGLPYTGSGTLASSLAMDKIMTKQVWLQQGLPTPRYAILRPDTDLAAVAAVLDLPLIIKPPHEGSTLGVTKVDGLDSLREAYQLAARYDADVLAEQFIVEIGRASCRERVCQYV